MSSLALGGQCSTTWLRIDEYLASLDTVNPRQDSLTDNGQPVDVMAAVEASEPTRSIEILNRLGAGVMIENLRERRQRL